MLSGGRYAGARAHVRELVAVGAVVGLLAGCGEESSRASPSAAPDDAPPAAPAPRRLVSLYPSATEIVLAIGQEDRLVARTDFDRDPRLAHLPSLGASLSPGIESILALRPDLVILSASASHGGRSIERLRELGVPLEVAEIQTVREVLAWTRRAGTLLGDPAAGDSVAAALDAELAGIGRAHERCTPLEVLYVLWPDPPRSAGQGTYVSEVIEAAGARNVLGDTPQAWPHPSLEEIVRRDPDFLIVPSPPRGTPLDGEALATRVGWRDLDAVRDGRVLPVEGDLFNRPGPRVAEAARTLGALLDAAVEGRCAS